MAGGEILRHLPRRRLADAGPGGEPSVSSLSPMGERAGVSGPAASRAARLTLPSPRAGEGAGWSVRCRGEQRPRSRSRDTACDSSSERPGASPSQNGMLGGWPCGVLDPQCAALDAADAVGGIAELEHVAGQALDREILVDGADDLVFRFEHDLIIGRVRDRAARGQRRDPRAAPAAQHPVDRVVMDQRAAPAAPGAEALRQHPHDRGEILARQLAVRATTRRNSANSASSLHSCAATSATICCASTSSGRSGRLRRSSSPRATLSSSAAHSTSSSRDSGNSRPFGVPPTA